MVETPKGPTKSTLPPAARPVRYASQDSVDVLTKKVDHMTGILTDILATLETLKSSPVPVPPSTLASLTPPMDMARTIYETCARAIADKEDYEEKEKRAVIIGSKEDKDPTKSHAHDEKLVSDLVEYSGDDEVKKAWSEGKITHHRHPKDRAPGSRPLKIDLPTKTLRDCFLSSIRSKPGRPTPLAAPAFIRRDLTPHQLQLEREARDEVRKKNLEAGSLSYGLRDYSVIAYSRPRPLPDNYGTPRNDRPAHPLNATADLTHSDNGSTALSSDASSLSSPTPSTTARDSHVNVNPRGAARR